MLIILQNQEVLTEGNEIKQELVRSLFHTLEIWETIREVHRHQLDNLKFLKSYKGNESWFRDTGGVATLTTDGSILLFQKALERLEAIDTDGLVLDTTTLISKVDPFHLNNSW